MAGFGAARFAFALTALLAGALGVAGSARANLRFEVKNASDGAYIRVSGEFEFDDSLDKFATLVRQNHPRFVTFDSPGGNISKAIDLGRLIRKSGLATFGSHDLECDSACAFSFFGGVERTADPDSIGMHKASLENPKGLSVDDAVSTIQELTAIEIAYMAEMGVDPGLLQVALNTDSSDIHYLSSGEMQRYRVVTDAPASTDTLAARTPPDTSTDTPDDTPTTQHPDRFPGRTTDHPPTRKSSASANAAFPVPAALSGRIRSADGSVGLRAQPDEHSRTIRTLANGTRVKILDDSGPWYRVSTPAGLGYAHESWVFVDQYLGGPFETRYIQVGSFKTYDAAEAFVQQSDLPLVAELARNGWFNVTVGSGRSAAAAEALLTKLKDQGEVPDDAFVTYGNTYVRVVCCQ